MNSEQKRKYLRTLLPILILVAGFFTMSSLYFENEWLRSALLNLATEFVGAAALFFLLEYYLRLDDWDLADQVKRLVNLLQNKRLSATQFFDVAPNLIPIISASKTIDLCGVSLTSTVKKNVNYLQEQLLNGANIRILLTRNNDESLWPAAWRSGYTDSPDYYRNHLNSTSLDIDMMYRSLADSKAQGNQKAGTLDVKYMKYAPTCGILMFNVDKNNGLILVDIYPHHVGYNKTPNFTLEPMRDEMWYKYFREQFEAMWKYASKPVPTNEDNPK